jgi:diguanylate cyclase (GGDEF)-like protein
LHGWARTAGGQFKAGGVDGLHSHPRCADIQWEHSLKAKQAVVAGKFLTEVLGQSEQIHELIRRCAEDLSSLNIAFERDLASRDALPAERGAIGMHQALARKLMEASERLAEVNRALLIEIRDRTLVDHQLAAAMEQEQGSRNAALHDHLTGLPNRVLFEDRLEHGIAQAMRHGWILAVMFVDLDNFKGINDAYGHQAGDAVLQAVAVRLAQNTRTEDTVSRHGGDEFLYLLTPLHAQNDIAMIASKILEAIQAPCDVRVGDVTVSVSLEASIGISVFPKDGASSIALIQRADDAMYAAKEHKSGVAFAQ